MDFIQIPYEGLAVERLRRGAAAPLIDPEEGLARTAPRRGREVRAGHGAARAPPGLHAGRRRGPRGRHQLHRRGGQRPEHGLAHAQPAHGFGTGVVMGRLGFTFNCRGDYFSLMPGQANALEPGKRPRSTLQSTLVIKDGKPFLVTGSPGGDDQCMRTMQTFLNMVEFGMNVQQAIEAPRWSTRAFPVVSFPHVMYPGDLMLESRVPAGQSRKRARRERTQGAASGRVVAGTRTPRSRWTPRPACSAPAPIRAWTPTRWPGDQARRPSAYDRVYELLRDEPTKPSWRGSRPSSGSPASARCPRTSPTSAARRSSCATNCGPRASTTPN